MDFGLINHSDTGSPANRLGSLLLSKRWTVATAESCTGGGIAQAITEVAGSSQWFEQGFVTYSNRAKHQQLHVSEKLLADYGAVSSRVVEAMATGALQIAGANIAVAVSGIAGPGGGTAAKPVGTVWIAWVIRDGALSSRCFRLSGDRHQIRQQTVTEALTGLNRHMERVL